MTNLVEVEVDSWIVTEVGERQAFLIYGGDSVTEEYFANSILWVLLLSNIESANIAKELRSLGYECSSKILHAWSKSENIPNNLVYRVNILKEVLSFVEYVYSTKTESRGRLLYPNKESNIVNFAEASDKKNATAVLFVFDLLREDLDHYRISESDFLNLLRSSVVLSKFSKPNFVNFLGHSFNEFESWISGEVFPTNPQRTILLIGLEIYIKTIYPKTNQ